MDHSGCSPWMSFGTTHARMWSKTVFWQGCPANRIQCARPSTLNTNCTCGKWPDTLLEQKPSFAFLQCFEPWLHFATMMDDTRACLQDRSASSSQAFPFGFLSSTNRKAPLGCDVTGKSRIHCTTTKPWRLTSSSKDRRQGTNLMLHKARPASVAHLENDLIAPCIAPLLVPKFRGDPRNSN